MAKAHAAAMMQTTIRKAAELSQSCFRYSMS